MRTSIHAWIPRWGIRRTVAATLAAGLIFGELSAVGLGALAGRPGNSGTLYANPVLKKQQLICDPEAPDSGSSSITYDPTKSTITEFEYGPGYGPLNGTSALIAVQSGGSTAQLVPIDTYFINRPSFKELGFVQVKYGFVPGAVGTGLAALEGEAQPAAVDPRGRITPQQGFFLVDRDPGVTGTQGVDTYDIVFDPAGNTPPTTVVTYKIFGAGPNFNGFGNAADFIQSAASGTVTATNDANNPIGFAVVSGSFLPEPSCLAAAALGGVCLLARRRRRA
jgi:hypothetical protein